MQTQAQKAFNKQTRDRNIAIEKTKKRTIDKAPGKPAPTKEDIKKAFKPKLTKVELKDDRPFIILRDQEKLLAEPDDFLIKAIRETYQKQDDKLKEKGDYKRSSLRFTHAKSCPREVYYDFYDPQRARPYTVKGQVLFKDGNLHHEDIQDRLGKQGILKDTEGFLHIEEVNANGYYDGLVIVEQNGRSYTCDILEIKSKFPFGIDNIYQIDYDQAQLYHYAASRSKHLGLQKIKIRDIRILYKDRANLTDEIYFAWHVKPDLDRQQEIMEYMRFLWNVVAGQKKLVPHPYEKKSTKCQWCRYKEWCWREYPDKIIEQPTVDLEKIQLPEEEILESHAKRFYEILKQEAELREEKKKLLPILVNYFIKSKKPFLPVNDAEALAPRQGKVTVWDVPGLADAVGLEMFAKIAKPESKKITELINTHFVDTAKFEKFKQYKLNKPSVYIKKL